MANNQSNTSSLVSNLGKVQDSKEFAESGALYIVQNNVADIEVLSARLSQAKSEDDASVRSTVLNFIDSDDYPEGKKMVAERAALADEKNKNVNERATFVALSKRLNNNIELLKRSVMVLEAIEALRSAGFNVRIVKVKKSNSLACYVKGKGEDGELEHEATIFSIAQLSRVTLVSWSDDMGAAEVRDACKTNKAGTPNNDKGANGSKIDASKLKEAVVAMDTSIAAYTGDKGLAVSKGAKEQLLLLFARLDATLSDEDKAKGRELFAKEGAAREDATATPKDDAKAKQEAMKAYTIAQRQ